MKKPLIVALVFSSTPALAQTPAAAPEPTPAPLVTAPAPAAPAPAPAPSLVRVYGLLNPRIIYSSAAVESYSQPNATATTAAGNPVYSTLAEDPRFTFQAGQSRFGIWAGEGTPLRAHIEFDFVDFTRPSPTVQSLPRVRLALVEFNPTPELTLVLGQDWDLIQPLNPHGINLVGGAFQAGNTAFMRQQLKAIYKSGDLEYGFAIGFPSNNATGGKDAALELGLVPTAALRVQLTSGKSKFGISGIVTSLLFNPGDFAVRGLAGEAGIYGDLSFGTSNLRLEAYIGQNVANLFLLGIGTGRSRNTGPADGFEVVDIQEAGAFLSGKVEVVPALASIYGTVGFASVLNKEDVIPSYGYAGTIDPQNPPAFAAAVLGGPGGGGIGIEQNLTVRLGGELKLPIKGAAFLFEGFLHMTTHKLQDIDVARAEADVTALGIETGFFYTF